MNRNSFLWKEPSLIHVSDHLVILNIAQWKMFEPKRMKLHSSGILYKAHVLGKAWIEMSLTFFIPCSCTSCTSIYFSSLQGWRAIEQVTWCGLHITTSSFLADHSLMSFTLWFHKVLGHHSSGGNEVQHSFLDCLSPKLTSPEITPRGT